MMAAGLIFSNIHDKNVPELTKSRTMASVPFGCRYRLIDFTLSNMVNADISKVGVITHNNYQSLMDHLGTGKDWDLARRSGGIKILPPYITAYDNNSSEKLYNTRLEALMGVLNFITRCTEEYLVLSDCDVICNIDLKEVLEDHASNGADITIVTKNVYLTSAEARHNIIIESDKSGRLISVNEFPKNLTGAHDISLNIWIVRRDFLETSILEAISGAYKSFNIDIIAKNAPIRNFRVYKFGGYYASVNSLAGYYACNMELLNSSVRNTLFNIENHSIYTKIRNSPPTRYGKEAKVKNSLIADGCVIEGTVENSILFRGCKIGKDSIVKNSILMQDTYVSDSVSLNCVISDKNVIIREGRNLSGHETMPFYLDKGKVV